MGPSSDVLTTFPAQVEGTTRRRLLRRNCQPAAGTETLWYGSASVASKF